MDLAVVSSHTSAQDDARVVTQALLRASSRLGVSQKAVARIIGVSEATVSRLQSGRLTLDPADKAFELAVLFLRLFRSLDALLGGDEAAARAWLRGPNLALGDAPLARIQTVTGLVDVVAYLDSRRAPL
jgi:transcriptional regulator with XRE-family HTH domain